MKPTNVGPKSKQNVITNKPGLAVYSRNVRDAFELFFTNEIVETIPTAMKEHIEYFLSDLAEKMKETHLNCFLRTKLLKRYLPI